MHLSFFGILQNLELFARAGGGGSGGGGSGGGGGIVLVGFIGYIPMHLLGAYIRKRFVTTNSWRLGQVIGWGCSLAFFILVLSLGVAAYFSTGPYSGAGFFTFLAFIVGIGGFVGMGAGLYAWFDALKRSRQAGLKLKASAALDPTWDESLILETAKELFFRYQTDWSRRDFEAMKPYMTEHYYRHATLLIAIMIQAGRINDVERPTIQKMMIVDSTDSTENSQDRVTVGLTAQANDKLIDQSNGEVLYRDTKPFTEFWKLKRSGNTWLLDGIDQATASKRSEQHELRKLAEDHDYFYSLDMGWLFIPKRGALFSFATFGTSDINNHIVGVYNQTYLLQLYTYASGAALDPTYVVAQTNIPKSYDRIVIRRKHFMSSKIKGLRKISMESGDFNKRYYVFASDSEAVTSFELLHPAFMEKLAALPFEVSIEVVDNIVYLYTPLQKGSTNRIEQYEIMLGILMEAYKQMRM